MAAITSARSERAGSLGWAGAAATLLGLGLGATSAPVDFPWVGAVYGAALFVLVSRAASTARAAFLLGGASGLGFAVFTLAWVPVVLERFGHLGWAPRAALTCVVALLQALPPAIGCAAFVWLDPRRLRASAFVVVLALAFELVPMLFPWRPLAMAVGFAPVLVWSSWGGALLGDVALMLPAALLVDVGEPLRARVGAALVVAALVLGGGTLRIGTLVEEGRRAPRVRVGAAQPAVPLARGRDRRERAARLRELREQTQALARRGARVVLWPESSHPFVLDRDSLKDLGAPHDTGAARYGVTVLAGAMTERDTCRRWNGVVALDAAGRRVGLVDKARRMPFGDYLPVVEWFVARARCRSLSPAEARMPLPVEAMPGALVCYDEVESRPARSMAARGAGVLVSFTNDAWYAGTRQPYLQETHARMRAVETGRDLVRAANLGGTMHIRPDGTVARELPRGTRGELEVSVPIRTSLTWATRLGAFPSLVLSIGALLYRRSKDSSGGR